MSDHLTEDERHEIEHELRIMREAENALLNVEVVSPEASIRRMETLGRLRGEIARVEALLAPTSAGALA
jgi:pyridoxine 5'-phosphate synthase PdxJ